ncbi:MAG: 50S ribosomal protein L15e [Candidatus Iainarchaeum archaeon]|uniref:50S ribosomal protein L15e n=1 Tax=Candidatus Iainarchaeum sp. TaxID=3101447 RepID=A0A7T9I2W7_9ARCH|nr:MAG: 50S ribosomal protein L15e [Candidatus Diapherotrites archaeon]
MKNATQQTIFNQISGKTVDGVDYSKLNRERLMDFRREPQAVVALDGPTNIRRAKSLGYKAKQGITVARVRIRRGGGLVLRPNRARKPKRMGVNKITRKKGIQAMAEERANKRFPNMEVLNSYLVGHDGKNKYFEVILVDPKHPSILADKNLNWIASNKHHGRVFKGKTSAGQRSRGLHNPAGARGTEKIRPSLRAHNRKGK